MGASVDGALGVLMGVAGGLCTGVAVKVIKFSVAIMTRGAKDESQQRARCQKTLHLPIS
jgi:hypothetical protein